MNCSIQSLPAAGTCAVCGSESWNCMAKYVQYVRGSAASSTGKDACVQYVEDGINGLQTKIDCWRDLGYERIANLCTHILKSEDGVFEKMRCWNTCAFTGITCSDVLQIKHGTLILHVHPMFEQFVLSMWLCGQIQTLEHEFANSNGNEIVCPDELRETSMKYAFAFQHVQNVLHETMKKIQVTH